MVAVSIVIVCMNSLNNLYPCLKSILKYTSVNYECFVVAYLFSEENLQKVKNNFPWVKFVESNEIRGFSENNNLALRQAKGKYCFVLNDDTEMKMPCIDKLVSTIERLPSNVAIVSPKLIYGDGSLCCCGRPPIRFRDIVMGDFRLKNVSHDKYINQQGVFKSYNIAGCAFLIKTEIFQKVGWFDERYFFCPEDVALSTELNNQGYECWVDTEAVLIHYEGMSGKSVSMVQTATKPAGMMGGIIFYGGGKWGKSLFVRMYYLFTNFIKFVFHSFTFKMGKDKITNKVLAVGELNCMREAFSSKTPKEIFEKYYLSLKMQ